jgi:hypothetical protein
MPLDGYGTGVLVESTMGRPTKVEGNPLHPASGGATDRFAQASVLQLWDPDRSRSVRRLDGTGLWSDFAAELRSQAARFERTGGAGLRILTSSISSPTAYSKPCPKRAGIATSPSTAPMRPRPVGALSESISRPIFTSKRPT